MEDRAITTQLLLNQAESLNLLGALAKPDYNTMESDVNG